MHALKRMHTFTYKQILFVLFILYLLLKNIKINNLEWEEIQIQNLIRQRKPKRQKPLLLY
jgi:hypothetical protein